MGEFRGGTLQFPVCYNGVADLLESIVGDAHLGIPHYLTVCSRLTVNFFHSLKTLFADSPVLFRAFLCIFGNDIHYLRHFCLDLLA